MDNTECLPIQNKSCGDFCCLQANLVVQEARLKVAAAELNSAQAQLDEKQSELDKVQAMYDGAVREKQVTTAIGNM